MQNSKDNYSVIVVTRSGEHITKRRNTSKYGAKKLKHRLELSGEYQSVYVSNA